MAVRLVVGRAGSGKTLLCLNEIKEKQAARRRRKAGITRMTDVDPSADGETGGLLIYLTPEQFNLEAEHDLIAHCGVDGLYDATVLTFKRISHRVFAELGGQNRRYISGTGKRICLTAVVEELRDSLVFHAGQVASDGFIDGLYELFAEFKRFGHDPDAVDAAAERAGDGELGKKLRELALIYRRYLARLDAEWLDTDDDLTRLAGMIPQSDLICKSEIWIDGFTGFTEQEYAVIAALMKHAAAVTVCLCGEPNLGAVIAAHTRGRDAAAVIAAHTRGRDAAAVIAAHTRGRDAGANSDARLFAPTDRAVAELLSRAARADIAAVIAAPERGRDAAAVIAAPERGRDAAAPALRYLERNLYRGGASPFTRDGGAAQTDCGDAVDFIRCADRYDEAAAAAAEIRTLCRERGLLYRDIAVICSELESYAAILGPVFERAGIPCFIDIKREITEHPLPRLIASLFAIVGGGYAYEPVFSYLKTGLTDIPRRDVDRLENFALAHGIRGGLWNDGSLWRSTSEGRALDGVRRTFVAPIEKFTSATRGNPDAGAFCDALYAFLCDCGARRGVVARMSHSADATAVSEWKQIWGFVTEVLDQIVSLGEKHSFQTYARMFSQGIAGFRVGTIPPSSDEVLVGSVGRTRSHRIKALLVLGANDGAFPAAPRPSGLLCDADRASLPAIDFNVEMDSAAAAFDLRFDVYRALTLPTRYLRLFWPSSGQGGKAQKPSRAVTMLERMFPRTRVEAPAAEDFARQTDSALTAFEHLIRACRAARDAAAAPSAPLSPSAAISPLADVAPSLGTRWRAVLDWFARDTDAAARLSAISASLCYRNPRVDLSGIYAKRLPPPASISVTRLERYAACPFSYLGEYVVKALPRREYRLEAPDIGVFVHRAIELTANEVTRDGLWDGLELGDAARRSGAVVERLLAENPSSAFNANRRNRHLTERVKSAVAWSLYAMARHVAAGRYRPWKFEMPFEDIPRAAGAAGAAAPALRGTVDRVDIALADPETDAGPGVAGFVRVIDFKTGHRELDMCDIVAGLAFQLPVYLDVALRAAAASHAAEPPLPARTAGAFLPGGLFYLEIKQPVLNVRDMERAGSAGNGGIRVGPEGDGALRETLLRQMVMKGFVVGGEQSFERNYERDIRARGKSETVKGVTLKRDGGYYSRVFAPSPGDFEFIRRAVSENIDKLCGALGGGCFDVSPYKKGGRSPCAFCAYGGACGLSLVEPAAAFRHIPRRGDKALLEILRRRYAT